MSTSAGTRMPNPLPSPPAMTPANCRPQGPGRIILRGSAGMHIPNQFTRMIISRPPNTIFMPKSVPARTCFRPNSSLENEVFRWTQTGGQQPTAEQMIHFRNGQPVKVLSVPRGGPRPLSPSAGFISVPRNGGRNVASAAAGKGVSNGSAPDAALYPDKAKFYNRFVSFLKVTPGSSQGVSNEHSSRSFCDAFARFISVMDKVGSNNDDDEEDNDDSDDCETGTIEGDHFSETLVGDKNSPLTHTFKSPNGPPQPSRFNSATPVRWNAKMMPPMAVLQQSRAAFQQHRAQLAVQQQGKPMAVQQNRALAFQQSKALAMQQNKALAMQQNKALAMQQSKALAMQQGKLLVFQQNQALAFQQNRKPANNRRNPLTLEKNGKLPPLRCNSRLLSLPAATKGGKVTRSAPTVSGGCAKVGLQPGVGLPVHGPVCRDLKRSQDDNQATTSAAGEPGLQVTSSGPDAQRPISTTDGSGDQEQTFVTTSGPGNQPSRITDVPPHVAPKEPTRARFPRACTSRVPNYTSFTIDLKYSDFDGRGNIKRPTDLTTTIARTQTNRRPTVGSFTNSVAAIASQSILTGSISPSEEKAGGKTALKSCRRPSVMLEKLTTARIEQLRGSLKRQHSPDPVSSSMPTASTAEPQDVPLVEPQNVPLTTPQCTTTEEDVAKEEVLVSTEVSCPMPVVSPTPAPKPVKNSRARKKATTPKKKKEKKEKSCTPCGNEKADLGGAPIAGPLPMDGSSVPSEVITATKSKPQSKRRKSAAQRSAASDGGEKLLMYVPNFMTHSDYQPTDEARMNRLFPNTGNWLADDYGYSFNGTPAVTTPCESGIDQQLPLPPPPPPKTQVDFCEQPWPCKVSAKLGSDGACSSNSTDSSSWMMMPPMDVGTHLQPLDLQTPKHPACISDSDSLLSGDPSGMFEQGGSRCRIGKRGQWQWQLLNSSGCTPLENATSLTPQPGDNPMNLPDETPKPIAKPKKSRAKKKKANSKEETADHPPPSDDCPESNQTKKTAKKAPSSRPKKPSKPKVKQEKKADKKSHENMEGSELDSTGNAPLKKCVKRKSTKGDQTVKKKSRSSAAEDSGKQSQQIDVNPISGSQENGQFFWGENSSDPNGASFGGTFSSSIDQACPGVYPATISTGNNDVIQANVVEANLVESPSQYGGGSVRYHEAPELVDPIENFLRSDSHKEIGDNPAFFPDLLGQSYEMKTAYHSNSSPVFGVDDGFNENCLVDHSAMLRGDGQDHRYTDGGMPTGFGPPDCNAHMSSWLAASMGLYTCECGAAFSDSWSCRQHQAKCTVWNQNAS